jgi:glucoamylase
MLKFMVLLTSLMPLLGIAQGPAGWPGVVPNWSSAKKVQTGTSFNRKSLVWFTNAQGVLTESYFPTIDQAQIKDAGLLITDGKNFLVEERTNTLQKVEVLSPSLVKLINRDHLNRFEVEHTFYTLTEKSVIVDEVTVRSFQDGLNYYLLINSALNNTGYQDTGKVLDKQFVFSEGETTLKVSSTIGFQKMSVGYVGFTDGFQDLQNNYVMDFQFPEAHDGNVAGLGHLALPAAKGEYRFYIVYSFENDDMTFSPEELAIHKNAYTKEWESYYAKLNTPANLNEQHLQLYYRSLFALKVHEDKLNPGALIASLSKPWGETTFEKPGVQVGGYHMVWPRDLYHVCLALIHAGDIQTTYDALNFLKRIQYQDGVWSYGERVIPRQGAFPQNVWVDTREYWGGLQLDQTAYPVHIFYQLWLRADEAQKSQLLKDYGTMIKLALEFIQNYGPWTAQERWEENYGISPDTFAAATSALIMGQRIFQNDKYLKTAHGWLTKPGDNIHTWTYTTSGHFDDGHYYIRIAGCNGYISQWNPNNGVFCHVANSPHYVEQTHMIDQGFLKLALLGLVPASDARIKRSKKVVDNHIKVKTPKGSGWYRYSHDAYGEDQKGRLWPLLSGEHGRYAIARFEEGDLSWKEAEVEVDRILDSYIGFANLGGMLPEQVFEHSGEGTGAATPLAWSHAEYIKLLWSKELKINVENLLK